MLAHKLRRASGGGSLLLEYIGTHHINSGSTTYNFGTVALGDAGEKYVIAVPLGFYSSTTGRVLSSASIDGLGATEVVKAVSTASGWSIPAGVYIRSTTNATGNVSVTFNGGMSDASVAIYAMYGHPDGVAFHSASNTASSGNDISISLNTPAGGVAVGGMRVNAISVGDPTWSGLTRDSYDSANVLGSNNEATHASANGLSAATPATITTTIGQTIRSACMVGASWSL